jgi:hypothetical protein
VMHDVIVHALLHGVPGNTVPWRDEQISFLCPVPGYDRHFAITEALGIRMIPLPYLEGGRLDLTAIGEHLQDPSVRGMWLVPMYANPGGHTVTPEEAEALVSLPSAAPDFRIFWDNAYSVHHLTDAEPSPHRRRTSTGTGCTPEFRPSGPTRSTSCATRASWARPRGSMHTCAGTANCWRRSSHSSSGCSPNA